MHKCLTVKVFTIYNIIVENRKLQKTSLELFIDLQKEWCQKDLNYYAASRKEGNKYIKLLSAAADETGLSFKEIRIIAAYRINPALREMILSDWYKLRNDIINLSVPNDNC